MDNINNVQCLSIIVCAGRSEVSEITKDTTTATTPTANIYLTIDIEKKMKPDIVGDLRTIHRQFRNDSIQLIVFRYCPFSVYFDRCISKWMQKLKTKGIMIFFGPQATDRFFQMLLKKHATSSRKHFQQFVYKQCIVLQRL